MSILLGQVPVVMDLFVLRRLSRPFKLSEWTSLKRRVYSWPALSGQSIVTDYHWPHPHTNDHNRQSTAASSISYNGKLKLSNGPQIPRFNTNNKTASLKSSNKLCNLWRSRINIVNARLLHNIIMKLFQTICLFSIFILVFLQLSCLAFENSEVQYYYWV